jgi:hypothetical protein
MYSVIDPIPFSYLFPTKKTKGKGRGVSEREVMGEENDFLDHGIGLLVTVSINQSLKLPDEVCSVFVFGSLSEIRADKKG